MKEIPQVEARGKKISIKIIDQLKSNTTYRFFFGNAISDMHEGNVLENFEFVFSTGTVIDSLMLSGKVENAFDLKPEKNVLVGLYPALSNDSIVYNEKPLYFTKSGADGFFKFRNLPKEKFRLYAFNDANKNMTYDAGNELIGYVKNETEPGNDSLLSLKVFMEDVSKQFLKKAFSPYYGKAIVVYNREQVNEPMAFNPEDATKICSMFSKNDTCEVFYGKIFDTLKLVIEHEKGIPSDTIIIDIPSKEKFEKLKTNKKSPFIPDLQQEIAGVFPYFEQPVIQFSEAIDKSSFDTSSVIVFCKTDSVRKKIAAKPVYKECDKLVYNEKIKENAEYEIVFNPGAVRAISGLSNDSAKITFRTGSAEDYSGLTVKLSLPAKENYIIELLNERDVVVSEQYMEQSISSSTDASIKFTYLKPGNYHLKLIEDSNKNKKWDTGSLILKRSAENIYINNTPVKLLSDWDSEIEWKVK